MSNYFDAANNIRTELLDGEANKKANSFVKKDERRPDQLIQKEKYTLTTTQLRRFFGEFRQLEKKVNAVGFEKVKPLIKMVKSKALYAANPDKPKIPPSFASFLIENIDQIKEKRDFEAFMLHFEAVVGFFYGIPGKSDR
jgi:CRISPR-associated protein Csm2